MARNFTFVEIDNSTGNLELAAAATGVTHHVHGWILHGTAGTASGARFEDGSGGTALTGVMDLSTGTAADGVFPSCAAISKDIPWCSTTAGTALNLEITGAIAGVVVVCSTS